MRAALYVDGRIVIGDSHLACFQRLTDAEQNSDLVSGFFDLESQQFISENDKDVFHNKELYLIRHATCCETDDPDPSISEVGVSQIKEVAERLSVRNLKSFQGFTSPMLRCLQTAAILQHILNIHFSIIPEVMETPNFLKEDQVFKLGNRSAIFPQFDWPVAKEWHVFPEHANDFFERVKDTLQRIPSQSIVISHYGFICLTVKIALCKKILDQGLPPASVTYLHGHEAERI